MNIVGNDGESILEAAYATDDETIILLITERQNINTLNKEIEETRKHLKKLQIKQIIDRKKELLAESEKTKTRLDELKKMLLEKQEERGNLEAQFRSLVEDTKSRSKRLNELLAKSNQINLEQQNTECHAAINNMLNKISEINESISKFTTHIQTIEVRTTDYERQKRVYENTSFITYAFKKENMTR